MFEGLRGLHPDPYSPVVKSVARSSRGGFNPGCSSTTQWQDFCSNVVHLSEKLPDSIAALSCQPANNSMFWLDVNAFMASRLIESDKKKPGFPQSESERCWIKF